MSNINRHIEDKIVKSLQDFPAVYIAGPRQSGKTTLAKQIAKSRHKASYFTFDDLQIKSAAQKDSIAFLRDLEGDVIIDEVQMVPEIFRPLKIIIDENRGLANGGKGKFLLTGSASVMALPKLSDALVGRMVLHNLYPLSATEISDSRNNFIDKLFGDNWSVKVLDNNVVDMIKRSSYPELFKLDDRDAIYNWCNGYLNTILQRDVRILLEVDKISSIPDMLRLFASRAGGLLNEASISRNIDLNHITAKKYRILLENLFLTLSVPAWSSNFGKRLIRAPKIYLSDLNLLSYLLNTDLQNVSQNNPMLYGAILENFVAIELTKQLTFSDIRGRLYHYRNSSGQEVDFIIEGPENKICAIEVKATSNVTAKDFRHLKTLQDDIGDKLHKGYVIYNGDKILPFGKGMYAIPFSAMWND